jgi:hypothetical protein
MTYRMALATAATLWLVPAGARAECVTPTAASLMTTRGIEFVFSGEAVNVTRSGELGERVTFHVTRVWKGSVPGRFDVYVWDLSEGRPRFETGRHYIATVAASSDARIRRDLGMSGSDAPLFLATMCSDPEMQPPTLDRDLGAGYEPKRLELVRPS